MIRKNKDLDKLSDDEFFEIVEPLDKTMDDYMSKFLNNYIAYYISKGYELNALWDNKLDVLINTVISENLSKYNIDYCDIDEIKNILEKEYKLKLISDNPIDIEEL